MTRRMIGLIITYALALLVAPLAADAQAAANVPRIGVLVFIAFGPNANLEAFRRILHALGWVEGQNIAIEYRWGEEQLDRLRDHAAELVRLNVDVIVASSSPAVQAARQATQTIPIVALDMETDPVASGLAASFARPGGNLTGVFLDQPALSGKWLELLREAVPDVTRVAVLWDAAINPEPLRATEIVAQSLRLPLHILEVRGPHEFERAFDTATRDRARALLVCQSPMFSVHQTRIADLAASRQLPTIAMFREFAQAGVLLSYGPNIQEVFRRAAIYVDKILKGTRPGDLPIERATTFELVINLKTAEALGLTIPPTLLFQATEVIR
jgi:putative tryptophan/tyrosine transport system substrate-binding protein